MSHHENTQWDVGHDRVPEIRFDEDLDTVHISNLRNFQYECNGSHAAAWETRSYKISRTCNVDFILVPFSLQPDLAHTMVSFGFDDGQHLVISVEARRRQGQPYSVLKGLFGAFKIIYVIADERDAIGYRTEVIRDSVHLYRSIATPEHAASFFRCMLRRADQLSAQKENYNTLFNNCLTNLRSHVNEIWPGRVPRGWGMLFTGHADHLAYNIGLLKPGESFESMREHAEINALAKGNWHREDFSQLIRARLPETAC